jgi:uncharacterized lipoprotein YajG
MFGERQYARRLLFLISAIFLLAGAAAAQSVLASLSGHVLDSSGAAIPTAQVTVVNVATGLTRTATASATGN